MTGAPRWYLRLRGDEKEFVTVWLTLRQRTLHHETQFMPGPETNIEATWEYLLKRNADLLGMSFALGPEEAVYLVGRVPVERVDDEELDRIMGASLAYTDECFPTAMTLGYEGRYRRRPRRTDRPASPASSQPRPLVASGMAPKLLVVGGGKMGSALLTGLIGGGWAPVADIWRWPIPTRPGAGVWPTPTPACRWSTARSPADGALLAVKPDVAEAVLRTLAAVGITRVLSIVAGLSTARLEAALAPGSVVVRAMPNTPALIGGGVAGMSGGSAATVGRPRLGRGHPRRRWARWSGCPSATSTP